MPKLAEIKINFCENIILGDFNSEPCEQPIKDFFHVCICQNIKDRTCFKNPRDPLCIDLVVTNRPKSFQYSTVIKTGLLDFYKMTLTVLKIFYKKKRPSIIRYLNCRNFENQFECFKRHVHFILEKDAHF